MAGVCTRAYRDVSVGQQWRLEASRLGATESAIDVWCAPLVVFGCFVGGGGWGWRVSAN